MPAENWEELRQRLIGFGEQSSRKSYFPELQRKLEELKESEGRFKALSDATFGGIIIHDNGIILECNKGLSDLTGFTYEELLGEETLNLIAKAFVDTVRLNIQNGYEERYECKGVRKDGSEYHLSIRGKNTTYKGRLAQVLEFRDITERKESEDEREKLQLQLNQAQKMESVGRLAGGVAHDFNNKLTIILGYLELAQNQLEEGHTITNKLKHIKVASESAAELTRQLLAFARKQPVKPQILDINETVTKMLSMLKRLIGEDIKLVWQPGVSVGNISIDPSQIDQILANLCVNARDSIKGVGTISITTECVKLSAQDLKIKEEMTAGDYVLLLVSDSGCGMDAETQAHIFEPFFTTKEIGHGTGLGLASVYGIMKQNGGFITVYSEPGLGTTFRVYLPRHLGEEQNIKPSEQKITSGNETVMLVEDDTTILDVTSQLLQSLGYTVLSAATPWKAIDIAQNHNGKIELLVTDVIMPEMNGLELSNMIRTLHPDIKLLFMSGYTADIIANQGILDIDVNFIQKPFSIAVLAEKMRGAIEKDG